MSRPLLELAPDVSALLDLIDETDGELTPENEKALEAWWAEIGEERDAKLDNYGALCRQLELRAAVRKEEQERLAKRVQADSNTVKRLKDRLKLFLELTNTKKVQTRRYQIALCHNGGKLPMEVTARPEELPERFQRKLIEIDRDLLYTAVSEGAIISGVKLLPRGTHVRIS